ncbi:hypothetical protein DKX38_000020 [Salix brachista]|uniref:Leucine-rich repeat-containing N-terminal plant-type domain-containing protein n=1 Tax=Salix brachista TaxID=2182728 RepID=A0A5N5P256_9ROSI|nr:hypothetical protein DKX38_000020 [Salix brachista]
MILVFSGNNFSGQIPKSISKIYRLILLDLSGNRFSGNIPDFRPNLLLAYIDFSYNELSGEIPVIFSQETRILSLGKNMFSGKLPSNLTDLNKLEHLDLQDNRIAGELPMSLCQMSTLQVLDLRNNTLEGSIPSTINNLANLRILDVSSNNLSGEIPAKLGNLVGMIDTPSTIKPVSDVFTFPIEFSDLIVNWKKSKQGLSSHSLEIYSLLDLSKNQFSGQLPATFGHLKALKLLNISYNHLSGKIPETFGNLESLESLDLSHNRLSGSIPRTLSKLQELTTLDVSNNKLEGKIPVGGQMDTMNDPDSYANNSGICGFQIQLPCPPEPTQVKLPEADDSWFSWQGAGIGYSVGFFATVTIILVSGCICRLPPQNRHRSHRRRRV